MHFISHVYLGKVFTQATLNANERCLILVANSRDAKSFESNPMQKITDENLNKKP